LKIQHALRAFTANDRKAIKLAAQNYPETQYYEVEEALTSLGIGEAFVTALNERGNPTPLAATMLRTPQSRMNVLSEAETEELVSRSALTGKYNQLIDRESAFEILNEKLLEKEKETENEKDEVKQVKTDRKEKSTIEEVLESPLTKQIGRTVFRELTRGLLGVLGISTTTRRRASKKWF
jgi:hypothetical protein